MVKFLIQTDSIVQITKNQLNNITIYYMLLRYIQKRSLN